MEPTPQKQYQPKTQQQRIDEAVRETKEDRLHQIGLLLHKAVIAGNRTQYLLPLSEAPEAATCLRKLIVEQLVDHALAPSEAIYPLLILQQLDTLMHEQGDQIGNLTLWEIQHTLLMNLVDSLQMWQTYYLHPMVEGYTRPQILAYLDELKALPLTEIVPLAGVLKS